MESTRTVRGPFRPGLTLSLALIFVLAAYGVYYDVTHGVSVGALLYASFLYCVSLEGITVGYHRYFTHGSFQCDERLKYILAFMGALSGEGPLWRWCPDHRQHHYKTEEDWDPHSPWRYVQPLGFLWAHTGWLCFETVRPPGYNPANRPEDAKVIAWQAKWYWTIVVVPGFIIPLWLFGWSGFWLCGFVRLCLALNVTWCVNSVCHLFGMRPLNMDNRTVYTDNQARNVALLALPSMGETWHGNHHVKQNAANLGRGNWSDPGWWLIRWLQGWDLIWDVKKF